MKKLLITLGLMGLTLSNALAQGTINPLNNVITRLKIECPLGTTRNLTAADGLAFSLWYGPAGSNAEDLQMYPSIATIGSDEGLLTGWSSVLALPGIDAGEVASVQIRAGSSGGLYRVTAVKQITLSPASGPGVIIWQRGDPAFIICPEPSTLAISALAGAFLLFRVRKSTKAN